MTKTSFKRHRRLRQNQMMRDIVRETLLHKEDLIYPLFVTEGENIKTEVPSMPGVYQWSLDRLDEEMADVYERGLSAVLLFGVPSHKDEVGSEAFNQEGIVQAAIKQIKARFPSLLVIADTCLCEFTDHGHCGVIEEGDVANDASLEWLTKTAVSQADAGADIIAPSNMMDGFVSEIRQGLDDAGHTQTPIMSYSVKYASAYYGPFRDAADSAPAFGDRRTYQMDPANRREALREAASDQAEGADFLMVKPALAYLDVIRDLRHHHELPIVAYNVSGEYAMVKAAARQGWIDEKQVVLESITSMKRAGADLVMTYFAKDIATWLDQ